jgi:CCR4-NOT transcription complex subunit 9
MYKGTPSKILTNPRSAAAAGGAAPGPAPAASVTLPPQSSASAGGASGGPGGATTAAGATASAANSDPAALANLEKLYLNVRDLIDSEKREAALLTLSKQREEFPDLAPILWHSVGTIAALLQEIVSIYPLLQSSDALTPKASNRCCNALALLQCVASHVDTRVHFLNAHIPLFLYPFLNTTHANRPFDFLRLTSLGVIGALVKVSCFLLCHL